MKNNKIIKPIIFVGSAILIALILSLVFTKFAETYKTNGTTNIDNQKDSILIGDKTIQEIIDTSNTPTNKPIQTPTDIPQKDNSLALDFIEGVINSSSGNSTNQGTNNSNKSEVFTKDYVIPQKVVQQLEDTGIEEIDAYFLKDIVMISDSIVSNYTETLSYALTAEFDKGLESLSYLEKNIEELENLKVSNSSLKKVKDYLKKGTQYYIDGFEDYFNYGDESESLFKSADTNFYNAQSTLQEYLNSFREE